MSAGAKRGADKGIIPLLEMKQGDLTAVFIRGKGSELVLCVFTLISNSHASHCTHSNLSGCR